MSKNEDELYAQRHSLAHITAAAVKRMWPEAKFGVGPVVDNGYYYDIDLGGDARISDENFKKIEKEMRKIIAEDQPFVHSTKPIEEALKWAKDNNQPYKVELLNDLEREGTTKADELTKAAMGVNLMDTFGASFGATKAVAKVGEVGFYTNGDFEDLCRGPHVASTGKVGAFKLDKVAGAYWRGDETKAQMQRLYGLAFATQEELDQHLKMIEEAKKRDHRKIGRALNLFTFSPLVGSGLPMYTPAGTIARDRLIGLSESLRKDIGFQKVWSPHITKKDLYEMSGHWDKFGDELFLVESQETSDELVMKPMNCPHHAQIYSSQPRSYKDLPIKFMETTTNYRDEKSGELHGLSRVRALTQDDSHTYCTLEQIDEVVKSLMSVVSDFYGAIGMDKLKVRLSFRDGTDAYLGDEKRWEFAQTKLEEIAKSEKLDYFVEEGEAAFYGPKVDFMAEDSIGREWQVGTIQIDIVQPERFDLKYINNEGAAEQPYMIHCAVMGSFDRFFSVYIEHTAGHFPFWLAPEQVRIVTVNDQTVEYVAEVEAIIKDTVLMKPLKYNEINYTVDRRSESMGKKIREAEVFKVPVVLIIGPKDQEARQVSVRTSDGESKLDIDKLGGFLKEM